MNHPLESTEPDGNLTRRDALMRALKGAFTIAAAAPVIVQASATAAPATHEHEPEYVPENDYPFFGCELPASMQ